LIILPLLGIDMHKMKGVWFCSGSGKMVFC
jgi:hypothetical protein